MSIIRHDPWNLMDVHDWLAKHMGKLEEESNMMSGKWRPLVDIKNEPKQYVVHVDLPGVDPDKIDVSMENNTLTIKGERETESKESEEGYLRIERECGSFYRSFTLPEDADSENIDAHTKNGVLVIEIPKKKASVAKKIKIKQKD